MEIVRPRESAEFRARDSLLEKTLRSDGVPFPIASEYPLVLAEEGALYSYCLKESGDTVAHANLWPRQLVNARGRPVLKVGLVGNVATSPQWQGRGFCRYLLQNLEKTAKSLDIKAIVLWSDLSQFYQNLGFTSPGGEWRLTFPAASQWSERPAGSDDFVLVDASSLSNTDLQEMLDLRYPVPLTLRRSVEEYRRLLTIPATAVFMLFRGNRIAAYCITGKGVDMAGVVHEWGADDPEVLAGGIATISRFLGDVPVTLLLPEKSRLNWKPVLARRAADCEKHPMAWVRFLTTDRRVRDVLGSSFIWGLDSI